MAINSTNQGVLNVNMTPASLANPNTVAAKVGVASDKGTYRGFGSNWVNAENIAAEDWMRAEQAQNNQLSRDLYFQEKANEFNAQEAQKARDYDREMSNSQYQRAVADMKKAGLNPVLALGGQGASYHSGASASSGGSRSSSGNNRFAGGDNSSGRLLGTIASVIAGVYTAGASTAAKIAAAKIGAQAATDSAKIKAKKSDSHTLIYRDDKATNVHKYYY